MLPAGRILLSTTGAGEGDVQKMLLTVVIGGTLAFGISALILYAFWRSLMQESTDGDLVFTRRSAIWLVALVLVLLAFAVVIFRTAYF